MLGPTGGAMTQGSTAGRRAARTRWRHVAVVIAAAAALSACSSQAPAGTPPIPSFPGPGASPSSSAPPPRNSILPTDCNQILSSDGLPNLLGLPLGSVKVTSLRDVPAPSAGRLERVTCTYTSQGGAGAPGSGTQLLKIIASGYTDPTAATAQAKVNQDIETSSGTPGQPVPLGAAQATYFQDSDGPLLVVVYGRVTTSLTLPTGAVVPGGQGREVLTDLAQRALPVLVPPGS